MEARAFVDMVVETGHSLVPQHGDSPARASSSDVTAAKPAGTPQAALPFSRWETVVRTCAEVTPVLNDIIRQFWGLPFQLRFFSASGKNHYFWKGDDYHVSQLMLGEGVNHQPSPTAHLRLSDTLCSGFLNRVLGTRPHPFSFRQLSPFEANLLNEFSKELFAGLMKNLIKKNGKIPPNAGMVNLVWTLQLEETQPALQTPGKSLSFKEPAEVGKLVVSLPLAAVNKLPAPDVSEALGIDDSFFFHVETTARIRVGSTRIPLADLDMLEPGDLVVFEDSQADRLWLIDPHTEAFLPFTAEIADRQYLEVPYTQEIEMMEQEQQLLTRQNLWDNLMIEVGAEFEPVKLPLKQLKQMSEGLVIELGDLVHNQIALHVDGKTLATGELIIVGDKFGVRISHVEATQGQGHEASASGETAPAALPVPAAAEEDLGMQSLAMAAMGDQAPAADEDDDFLDGDFDDDAFDNEDDW